MQFTETVSRIFMLLISVLKFTICILRKNLKVKIDFFFFKLPKANTLILKQYTDHLFPKQPRAIEILV